MAACDRIRVITQNRGARRKAGPFFFGQPEPSPPARGRGSEVTRTVSLRTLLPSRLREGPGVGLSTTIHPRSRCACRSTSTPLCPSVSRRGRREGRDRRGEAGEACPRHTLSRQTPGMISKLLRSMQYSPCGLCLLRDLCVNPVPTGARLSTLPSDKCSAIVPTQRVCARLFGHCPSLYPPAARTQRAAAARHPAGPPAKVTPS